MIKRRHFTVFCCGRCNVAPTEQKMAWARLPRRCLHNLAPHDGTQNSCAHFRGSPRQVKPSFVTNLSLVASVQRSPAKNDETGARRYEFGLPTIMLRGCSSGRSVLRRRGRWRGRSTLRAWRGRSGVSGGFSRITKEVSFFLRRRWMVPPCCGMIPPHG